MPLNTASEPSALLMPQSNPLSTCTVAFSLRFTSIIWMILTSFTTMVERLRYAVTFSRTYSILHGEGDNLIQIGLVAIGCINRQSRQIHVGRIVMLNQKFSAAFCGLH